MREEKLKQVVTELLFNIPIQVEKVDVLVQEDHVKVSIESSDAERLIGPKGIVLQALNHIVRRLFDKEIEPERKIIVDVNGYREKEERHIKQAAKALGEKVLAFRQEIAMEPMGPYQRMLVHAVFTNHPNLKTESRGEGPLRHIVIRYIEKNL